MIKPNLHENLLKELKLRVQKSSELVTILSGILNLGKEAIYRRLRGEVRFTFEEVSTICYHLGLSLDSLSETSDLKRPFSFKIADFANPEEKDYELINEFVDFLKFIKDSPITEMGFAAKLIPDGLHINYSYITRFYLFKWIYQYDNYSNIKKFEDVKGTDRILDILRDMTYHLQFIKKTYYIFDKRIFENFVDDIKYFKSIELINDDDVESLKKDLFSCLDSIEQLASKGINKLGNKTEIYLSNLNFEAGFSYIESELYKVSTIRAFTMYDITSSDVITFEKSIQWMQSLKRASTLISESGEIDRYNFFNKQREIVDTL
ncbi:MAG TPA: hypothetical protein DIT04_07130 [Dysgonomonas sp.]|nr:hypothetical protein [Dysgonomonas sp.]